MQASMVLETADPDLHKHLSRLASAMGHTPTQCAFQSVFILFTRELPVGDGVAVESLYFLPHVSL